MLKGIDTHVKWVRTILLNAAAVLRLWPKLPRDMTRAPVCAPAALAPVLRIEHQWDVASRGWKRCTACMKSTRGTEWRDSSCSGTPAIVKLTHPTHLQMTCLAGDEVLLACMACGAYGVKRSPLLAAPCTHVVVPNRKKVLTRIENGFHPGDKPQLRDVRLVLNACSSSGA